MKHYDRLGRIILSLSFALCSTLPLKAMASAMSGDFFFLKGILEYPEIIAAILELVCCTLAVFRALFILIYGSFWTKFDMVV